MRRYHPLFACLGVVLACLASGLLECARTVLTPKQARGGEFYGRMCAVCHGATGLGYKADQATALAHPGFLGSATDDFLRNAIAYGRNATTMSAWSTDRGGPLGRSDVDAVVAFLRTWERRPHAVLDEQPLMGDRARGGTIYAEQCARCHGARGQGGPNVGIGNIQFLVSASNGFLRYAIADGRRGTPMPSFRDTLGERGIDDVVAFLRSWQLAAPSEPRPPAARPPPLPLGPVPLNPKGPEPVGFVPYPATVSVDQVKAQLDRHARMALLDARAPSDYTGEHIAGAVSVPFYDPDPYVAALPKNAWLVCYCACPRAESGTLAQKLLDKGFTKVTVLAEGIGVWRAKQYGTRTGAEP